MKGSGTELNGGSIMPSSSGRGKQWIDRQVKKLKDIIEIKNVLDIGVGCGTYKDRYNFLLKDAFWTGIEIWPNYISKYNLNEKYQKIINEDARKFDFSNLENQNIVFAGDVLEHMTKDDAVFLVDNILKNADSLIVSIPIIHMPQGVYEGNPYEEHIKDDWSDEEFRSTYKDLIIDSAIDGEIGVYLLSKNKKITENFLSSKKLKIAIYTISKNEEKYVDKWVSTNTEADLRLVCDTGSTDQTVNKLKSHGITVIPISVMPWRFDVARQTALNLLPPDIDVCIWQDLDEELLPGWREQIEKIWSNDLTTLNHRYRNNNNPWQWHSKIHSRHNCRWTGAVHETLIWNVEEKSAWAPDLYLDEHQDFTKDRKSYLNLLLKKIKEGDEYWKTYYFLANDYINQGRRTEAIDARIKSYELCNDGSIVKSYIARNIARNFLDSSDKDSAYKWFKISIDDSDEKESWFFLCELYYQNQEWDQCYIAAKKCISITDKRDGFTYDPKAWDYFVYDYAALAAYNLELYKQAVKYGRLAIDHSPSDQRLRKNLDFFLEKV
jgi:tetratricopeptide (TPR) repeat protein